MSAKPRFDWFQSDLQIALTILKKGVPLDECQVEYNKSNKKLTVRWKDDVLFEEELNGEVVVDDMTVQCTPSKIEVKIPKKNRGEKWTSLIHSEGSNGTTTMNTVTSGPSVSFAKKNWDAIEKEAIKAEEEEQGEGDAAVNKMFQKIYQNASDDVKKAMIKSYQESAGTVLSTNWEDIKARKVDVQPPDCMEYKKYES